ncbi:Retrovirus-related Pol polyprotein from transposon RE1, partial [Bienertia sinuspersici]
MGSKENKAEGSEEGGMAYGDPLFLASSDILGVLISSMIINGSNFLNFSRSIRKALRSKNILGFIDGSLKKPEEGSKDYHRWVKNDYMIRMGMEQVDPSTRITIACGYNSGGLYKLLIGEQYEDQKRRKESVKIAGAVDFQKEETKKLKMEEIKRMQVRL